MATISPASFLLGFSRPVLLAFYSCLAPEVGLFCSHLPAADPSVSSIGDFKHTSLCFHTYLLPPYALSAALPSFLWRAAIVYTSPPASSWTQTPHFSPCQVSPFLIPLSSRREASSMVQGSSFLLFHALLSAHLMVEFICCMSGVLKPFCLFP